MVCAHDIVPTEHLSFLERTQVQHQSLQGSVCVVLPGKPQSERPGSIVVSLCSLPDCGQWHGISYHTLIKQSRDHEDECPGSLLFPAFRYTTAGRRLSARAVTKGELGLGGGRWASGTHYPPPENSASAL